MQLFIKYFDDEITKIETLAKGDWIDLRAAEDVEMKAGEFRYPRRTSWPVILRKSLTDGWICFLQSRWAADRLFF